VLLEIAGRGSGCRPHSRPFRAANGGHGATTRGMPPSEPFKPSEEANHPWAPAWGSTRAEWSGCATRAPPVGTARRATGGMTPAQPGGGPRHDVAGGPDLTGRKNERQAWDALFRDFNNAHSLGVPDIVPERESRLRSIAIRTGARSGAPRATNLRGGTAGLPWDPITACPARTPWQPWSRN